MAWQNPKTDWVVNPKNPTAEDFNRIEGNIDFLKGDIETKKGAIVNALNTVGLASSLEDTHATLASRITGSNQGTKIITPSTVNQTIAKGFHSGQGYVKGDANLKAANIKKGVSIFGVSGSLLSSLSVAGSGSEGAWGGPDAATFSISFPAPGILVGFAFAYKYGGKNAGDEVERTVTIDGVEVSTTYLREPSIGYRNVGAGTRRVVCSSEDTPYAVCPAAAIGITLS